MRFVKVTQPEGFINVQAITRLYLLEPAGSLSKPTGYYVAARTMDGETACLDKFHESREAAQKELDDLLAKLTALE